MKKNGLEEVTLSRTKLNQDMYSEIYKDDETEFSRETYRKENKISSLFNDDINIDETLELKFEKIDEVKRRSDLTIESFLDLEANREEYKSLFKQNQLLKTFEKPKPETIDYEEMISQIKTTGEFKINNFRDEEVIVDDFSKTVELEVFNEVSTSLNDTIERKYRELNELKRNLEDETEPFIVESIKENNIAKADISDEELEYYQNKSMFEKEGFDTNTPIKQLVTRPSEIEVDTDIINQVLNPSVDDQKNLFSDLLDDEGNHEDEGVLTSLIDNINSNHTSKTEVDKKTLATALKVDPYFERTYDLNDDLFDITSTLSIEGLSEIEESIKKNNRLIKILLGIFLIITLILSYLLVTNYM